MYKQGKTHRNSQPRFYGPGKTYYIVTKTHKNFPYFREPIFCDLMVDQLWLARQIKRFKLYGFSIIYDHLNLLLEPGKDANISQVMHYIKRHFSRNANIIVGHDNINFEGAVGQPRLHSDEYTNNPEVRKLDDKLSDYRKKFIGVHGHPQYDIPQFVWQKSYHDHVIRGQNDFYNHWRYTVYNYLKHDLPDDWRYTSLEYEDMIDEIEL